MRILIVHERYAIRGGEDVAVDADIALLTSAGHQVHTLLLDNRVIAQMPFVSRLSLLWTTAWSWRSSALVQDTILSVKPNVVHFHNTLPLLSPASIRTASRCGVPVVMTLHNYRLLCPAGTLFRRGAVCEDCVSGTLFRGIRHRCYRGSALQTLAGALMIKTHRVMHTWDDHVDAFICLSQFMKDKMSSAGLPVNRLHIRTNAVNHISPTDSKQGYVVVLGRLSVEKGIHTVLQLARQYPDIEIRIAGAGPLEQEVMTATRHCVNLNYLGSLTSHDAKRLLSQASLLLFPSIWYEGQPMVLLEALSAGVPVVACRMGAARDILEENVNSLMFNPGDLQGCATAIRTLLDSSVIRTAFGLAARRTFEERFSLTASYNELMNVYERAIASARARHHEAA
jgi:glycosyltransferase involved in cell wall biosynthesis